MSCKVRDRGLRETSRNLPSRFTAHRARVSPTRAAVNQISLPDADQAIPPALAQPAAKVRTFPLRSVTLISPASSPRTGCSIKAMELPSRETLIQLTNPPAL